MFGWFFLQPTNILLGANFKGKLSDFGLSKVMDLGQSYVSSEVRGTFGYVDPEYQRNHHVNPSGDVYSFGVVLLQILSGKRVINLNMKKPMSLDKMVRTDHLFPNCGSILYTRLKQLLHSTNCTYAAALGLSVSLKTECTSSRIWTTQESSRM